MMMHEEDDIVVKYGEGMASYIRIFIWHGLYKSGTKPVAYPRSYLLRIVLVRLTRSSYYVTHACYILYLLFYIVVHDRPVVTSFLFLFISSLPSTLRKTSHLLSLYFIWP